MKLKKRLMAQQTRKNPTDQRKRKLTLASDCTSSWSLLLFYFQKEVYLETANDVQKTKMSDTVQSQCLLVV